MKFKKTLLTMATMGIFSGTALGLEIGDPMPNLMGRGITQTKITKDSVVNYYPYESEKDSGKWEYAGAVALDPKCGKATIYPFAIQSFKEMEIYVDLNNNKKIDRIFKEKINEESILKIRHHCSYYNPNRTEA